MASLDYAYRRLVNTLGPERVARSEFERMVYSHDFASLPKIALLQWRLYPDFVALPQTTEEVAALVKLSDESLLQITPRGGGTGWCGGSVPNRGGVLVDMRKMNNVLALDRVPRRCPRTAREPHAALPRSGGDPGERDEGGPARRPEAGGLEASDLLLSQPRGCRSVPQRDRRRGPHALSRGPHGPRPLRVRPGPPGGQSGSHGPRPRRRARFQGRRRPPGERNDRP